MGTISAAAQSLLSFKGQVMTLHSYFHQAGIKAVQVLATPTFASL